VSSFNSSKTFFPLNTRKIKMLKQICIKLRKLFFSFSPPPSDYPHWLFDVSNEIKFHWTRHFICMLFFDFFALNSGASLIAVPRTLKALRIILLVSLSSFSGLSPTCSSPEPTGHPQAAEAAPSLQTTVPVRI